MSRLPVEGAARAAPGSRDRAGSQPLARSVAPVLVLAAHGSRDPAAQRVARVIARQVAGLVGVETLAAFVQHAAPSVREAVGLAGGQGEAVVLPLLLAGGHHLAADIRPLAAAAGARVAAPLGPDRLLAGALADRLRDAGAPEGAPVVLAAAGSSDPRARADARRQAQLLARCWQGEVLAAFASGPGPSVAEAAAELAGPARRPVALALYLLAPGAFSERLSRAGGSWHGAPLGGHPVVARVAAERFRAVCSSPAVAPLPC